MARRSSRPIGFQFPNDLPEPPVAERRPLAVASAAIAPARHLAKEGEACPTCGRELTPAERLGPWRRTHAFAGEEARPAPMGPHAPLPEADHASSRSLRRAGQRSAAVAPGPAQSSTRPRGRVATEAPSLELDSWQGASHPAGVRARSPRPAPAGELAAIVAGLAAEPGREGCLVHSERLPARNARFADPEAPLPESLRAALAADGIGQLWLHQAARPRRRPPRRERRGGDRHGQRQDPLLQPARLRDPARRPAGHGALPVPDQGPRAGPAQDRCSASREPARTGPPAPGHLRRRHPHAHSGEACAPRGGSCSPTPTCSTAASCPTTRAGRASS